MRMSTLSDLPDEIPLFPLPGALLLPRGKLPLHIFEPRYLQMVEDCLKTPARLIGMIQPRSAPAEGPEQELAAVGCAGRLTAFSETEDGRYMITLSGVSRFRLLSQTEGFSPYLRGKVSWREFPRDPDCRPEKDPDFDRAGFTALLARYLEARGLETDWETIRVAEDELLIGLLSALLPLGPEDRQALLEAPGLAERRATLTTLLQLGLCGGCEGRRQ